MATVRYQQITNSLTIDVEDYFHVSAFDGLSNPDTWDTFPSRVEANTRRLLDILAHHSVQATFFVMGWVAERHPRLVREIVAAGHEIGCHSYLHRRIYELGPDRFQEDTRKAKAILEDITGTPVHAYRAPSYSITKASLWALDILAELGFTIDSSIFPIHHDLYGIPDAPRFPYVIDGINMIEYPLSTALFLGRKIPVAGGGYFRLFPYWFTQTMLHRINVQEGQPFVFYLHPWEIDPEQPRMAGASWKSRFRHYNNLTKTENRLHRLLAAFPFGPLGGTPSPATST